MLHSTAVLLYNAGVYAPRCQRRMGILAVGRGAGERAGGGGKAGHLPAHKGTDITDVTQTLLFYKTVLHMGVVRATARQCACLCARA